MRTIENMVRGLAEAAVISPCGYVIIDSILNDNKPNQFIATGSVVLWAIVRGNNRIASYVDGYNDGLNQNSPSTDESHLQNARITPFFDQDNV